MSNHAPGPWKVYRSVIQDAHETIFDHLWGRLLTVASPALLVALLAGCATTGEQRVVWHKASDTDLYALCNDTNVRGCYWRSGGVCHVVAPDIGQWSPHTLETLGHEIKHCFDVSWHD